MKQTISSKVGQIFAILFFFAVSMFVLKYFHKRPVLKEISQEWYNDLIFRDNSFSFQFFRTMGWTYGGAADIGECIATGRSIKDGDITSWYTQWFKTAERIHSLAKKWEQEGFVISSREAYSRASNYYRASGFYSVAPNERDRARRAWALSRSCFLKAIKSQQNVTHVRIPYENTTLPGYLIRAKKEKAPLLIIHSGFDGTAEEACWSCAFAAAERGYTSLVFEGPGQGEMIMKQNLPFRYDWEHVVTPVVDYAVKLPGIDEKNIVLIGISLGGYLAPRAVAFEKRIKVCIANGGIFDFSHMFYRQLPAPLLLLAEKSPEKFNTILRKAIKDKVYIRWGLDNAIWRFRAKGPADCMLKVKKYNLKDVIKNITCQMLVIDSQGETMLEGESKKLYDALKSPKTFMLFTREEAAQAHVQMGAKAISSEKIFNWLDSVLKKD